jgi:hypothetical protein
VMPGADLSNLDLREQILAGAQLQGADLRNSLLDSAVLVRAALDGARLSGSSLFSADASKASLSEARLTGVHARRSTWRRALLLHADLTGAMLDDADLRGSELIGARLDRASLVRADLRNAALLGATFKHADLSGARVDGAATDPRTFVGAQGISGAPVVRLQSTPRRRRPDEAEFVLRVAEELRRRQIDIHSGFDVGPDLVAIPGRSVFAAIEVSTSDARDRLFRLADRADLIVVPEGLDVRRAMNGTRVAELSEAYAALVGLDLAEVKPFGAAAVVIREAARLRPYLMLAAEAKADPSFLSTLSVYIDSGEPFLASSRVRRVAAQVPAHLDGAMAARGARWAEQHREDLSELISRAAHLRQGEVVATARLAQLAWRALELENEMSADIRPRSED